MKFLIISVGKQHDPLIEQGIIDYTARISRHIPVEWRLLSGAKPSQDATGVVEKKQEAELILAALNDKDYVIVLDERGKERTSEEFAADIDRVMTEGTNRVVFVIGGAYGIHEDVLARANKVLALSKLIFPHQLVRLILVEQIYRALSILRGEKYHHA